MERPECFVPLPREDRLRVRLAGSNEPIYTITIETNFSPADIAMLRAAAEAIWPKGEGFTFADALGRLERFAALADR